MHRPLRPALRMTRCPPTSKSPSDALCQWLKVRVSSPRPTAPSRTAVITSAGSVTSVGMARLECVHGEDVMVKTAGRAWSDPLPDLAHAGRDLSLGEGHCCRRCHKHPVHEVIGIGIGHHHRDAVVPLGMLDQASGAKVVAAAIFAGVLLRDRLALAEGAGSQRWPAAVVATSPAERARPRTAADQARGGQPDADHADAQYQSAVARTSESSRPRCAWV